MSALSYKELKAHVGHKIACVTYGKPVQNVAVECETCNEVLLDYDKPSKVIANRKKMLKEENPEEIYPIEDWQYDVANGYTKLGYKEWVKHNIESHKE